MTSDHSARALLFRRLHEEDLLLLANAWDAGSARLMESLGARAVATTSAAVAWSHGYADGNFLPVPRLAAAVADMVRAIRVPLSVDMEGGYSDEAAVVGENIARVLGEGAVGINLEDGIGAPDLLCAKIGQARRAGDRLGVQLFVNARTDVYVRNLVPVERRLEETLARAERYRAAGADGIFVLGLTEPAAIRTIAASVQLPLNVLARADLPAATELAALGVRRLSAGSAIAEVMYGRMAALAADFLRTGISAPLLADAMPYREINALMAAR